jgi:uncharacterized protein (TIRG00374 family)
VLAAALALLASSVGLVVAFARVHVRGGLRVEARLGLGELARALGAARAAWLVVFAVASGLTLVARTLQLRALARRRVLVSEPSLINSGPAPPLVSEPSLINSGPAPPLVSEPSLINSPGPPPAASEDPPSTSAVWRAVSVSALAHNLLPGRLGEAIRVLLLAREADIPPAAATAAVALERLLDLIALLAVTCVPSLLLGRAAGPLRHTSLIGATTAAVLVAALGLLWRHHATAIACLQRVRPSLARALTGFIDGLSAVATPRRLLAAAVPSLTLPVLLTLANAAALHAFGLHASHALALVAVTQLAVAVPSAPSSVGVYHAVATWLLATTGEPAAPTAAFAISTHALAVASSSALGAIALFGRSRRASGAPSSPPGGRGATR